MNMISLHLLIAPKIKLIGKLLLLGLKSGTAFYTERGCGRVCRIGSGASADSMFPVNC